MPLVMPTEVSSRILLEIICELLPRLLHIFSKSSKDYFKNYFRDSFVNLPLTLSEYPLAVPAKNLPGVLKKYQGILSDIILTFSP